MEPFSISTFEDELYGTIPTYRAIFKVNKFDGSGFSWVKRNVKSPTGIAAIHKSRQPHGK